MSQFYKNNTTNETYRLYEKVSNGVILTKYDKKTGTPISNSCYKLFITKEELSLAYSPFEFVLEISQEIDAIIRKNLYEFIYQFRNYGVAEQEAQAFEEFYQSSSFRFNVYQEMVKNSKTEFKYLLINDDDEFEFGEAEQLFNMLVGGMIPIMKKMLVELESVLTKNLQASEDLK